MKRKLLLPLLIVVLAIGGFTGCGTLDTSGPYAGNKVLYQSDLTLATAYGVIDGFLVWETAHRGKPECPAEVTQAADNIRLKAPVAFAAALAARDTYMKATTTTNADALQVTLTALQQLVSIANQYLIPQIGKA